MIDDNKSFNKYLLSTYYFPVTVLDIENTAENKETNQQIIYQRLTNVMKQNTAELSDGNWALLYVYEGEQKGK